MAYLEIPSDDINVGKPVKKSLFQKIRDNFIDHESRISALSAGANKVAVIDYYFNPANFRIGEIIASDMTEAAFNAANGGGWLLCNNQSAAGTLYNTITGYSTVPDLRDQFLRGASGSVTLRTAYADATAVNGLTASTSTTTTTTVDALEFASDSHNHVYASYEDDDVTDFKNSITASTGGKARETTNNRNTALNGAAHTHDVNLTSVSTSTTTLSGDSETRPQNMGVNFFIRVNTSTRIRFKAREDMTIVNVKGYLAYSSPSYAPTAGNFEFDLKKGATIAALTSVYSVKPILAYSGGIADGDATSSGTVISGGYDVTAGDWIQVETTSMMTSQSGFYIQVFAEPA